MTKSRPSAACASAVAGCNIFRVTMFGLGDNLIEVLDCVLERDELVASDGIDSSKRFDQDTTHLRNRTGNGPGVVSGRQDRHPSGRFSSGWSHRGVAAGSLDLTFGGTSGSKACHAIFRRDFSAEKSPAGISTTSPKVAAICPF
jgi:hypothetical protein